MAGGDLLGGFGFPLIGVIPAAFHSALCSSVTVGGALCGGVFTGCSAFGFSIGIVFCGGGSGVASSGGDTGAAFSGGETGAAFSGGDIRCGGALTPTSLGGVCLQYDPSLQYTVSGGSLKPTRSPCAPAALAGSVFGHNGAGLVGLVFGHTGGNLEYI